MRSPYAISVVTVRDFSWNDQSGVTMLTEMLSGIFVATTIDLEFYSEICYRKGEIVNRSLTERPPFPLLRVKY